MVIKDNSQIAVAVEIVTLMRQSGIELRSITFKPNGSVTANYDGRVELIIGTPFDLESKLEVAALVLGEGKIAKNESGELDLTIDGRGTFTPDYLLDDPANEPEDGGEGGEDTPAE